MEKGHIPDHTTWRAENLPFISQILCLILDGIGFSESIRAIQINTAIMIDTLDNLKMITDYRLHCCLDIGSRVEGTSSAELHSDKDTMYCNPFMPVKVKMEKKRKFLKPFMTRAHLFMLKDNLTPPGYTKLQLVENGSVVKTETDIKCNGTNRIHQFEHFRQDQNERLVLSNQFDPYTDFQTDGRHGPAVTVNIQGCIPQDIVRAYVCSELPEEVTPWFCRPRKYEWPSKTVRDLFKKLGCFVVPVGCPESQENTLQWRISLSLQERYLMVNLSPVQYKCYILLKTIKTSLITLNVGEGITSYHCKTALFYTIEDNSENIWTENNLIICLLKCLEQLYNWVSNAYCPNYFIPDENMFKGKLSKSVQGELLVYLNDLIESNGQFLLNLCTFDIGKKLRHSIRNSNYVSVHETKITHESKIVSQNTSLLACSVGRFCRDIQTFNCKMNYESMLEKVFDFIENIFTVISTNHWRYNVLPFGIVTRFLYLPYASAIATAFDTNDLINGHGILLNKENDTKWFLEALSIAKSKVWTLMASLRVRQCVHVNNIKGHLEVNKHFDLGKSTNYLPNRLKKLGLMYLRNMFTSCTTALDKLVSKETKTVNMCKCSQGIIYQYKRLLYLVAFQEEEKVKHHRGNFDVNVNNPPHPVDILKNHISMCLIYDKFELEAIPIPVPMIYEAYKSFGVTPWSSNNKIEDGPDKVVIDPVIYLHYLQIQCAEHLNKPSNACLALQRLEDEIFLVKSDYLGHRETALNLLGHVYRTKGWHRLAFQCFNLSHNIIPFYNSAKWHILFLISNV